jgi:hypothetical protein
MNSILSIYQNNNTALEGKTLSQILAFTGDGKLRDNNKTSNDFREFLNEIPSQLITQFANNCLTDAFTESGLALQDIINQIGKRLSFTVENGLYRGNQNDIGFDGIWTSKEGYSIVLEVKTTDAYRMNLDDTVAKYRTKLIEKQKISKTESSILIVVGREDTGGLEAQIRGSKHAWDIRLISTDSLIKLLTLKETLNDTKTIQQITELLKPKEYTRIDQLIELIFVTSKDLQIEIPTEEEIEEATTEKIARESSKDRSTPVNFNEECFLRVKNKFGINLVKQSRVSYSNQEKSTGLICAVSKEYEQGQYKKFWFAFHPHQQEFLSEFQNSYVAFGCGSPDDILLIPFKEFQPFLKNCGTTENDERMYWHIVIHFRDNKFLIGQPGQGRGSMTDLTKYKI